MTDLAGQVALVTGGGGGLGGEIALQLAAAGAGIAVVARSQDQLAETVAPVDVRSGICDMPTFVVVSPCPRTSSISTSTTTASSTC